MKSYEDAVEAIDGSLRTMGLDHLDLMIIHSPQPWQEFRSEDRYFDGNREAWRALEEAYEAGKLRAIGVSNFEREDIDNILDACTVEADGQPDPGAHRQHAARADHYSQEQGILVEAYSPIAHGELLKNERVREIADKYDVSVPQLSIRYTLQLGLLPLPKTANPEHMKSNAEVDFEISDEDMETLRTSTRSTTTARPAQCQCSGEASLEDPTAHECPDGRQTRPEGGPRKVDPHPGRRHPAHSAAR